MCSTGECFNISKREEVYPPICSLFAKIAREHTRLFILELQNLANATFNESLDKIEPPPVEETSYDHTWLEIVIPMISILGIVGNAINIAVLTRRRMLSSMDRLEKSANYGLVALAVSDMLFCMAVFPHGFISEESYIEDTGSSRLYYKLYGIAFVNLFLMISTWLIVAMSINRYIVVVYPLHARSTLSTFRTGLVIVLVYIVSVIMTLPFFVQFKVVECLDLDRNVQYEYEPTFRAKVSEAVIFYIRWVWPIFADFIPIVILAICNTRLIWELKRATSTRKRTAHGQIVKESNHKVTLTLVIIVLMLLFLVSPSEVMRYINPYESWGNTGHMVASITNVLQAFNFAFNFILYCVVSATFRLTLKSMFARCYKDGADKAEMQSMLTHVNTSMDKTIITDTEINTSMDKTIIIDTEIY